MFSIKNYIDFEILQKDSKGSLLLNCIFASYGTHFSNRLWK